MTSNEVLRSLASEIQLFNDIEQKETFLFVLGALFSRVISLKKAAEIMEMEPDVFLEVLDLMGLEFSYLTIQDVAIEQNW
jgi:predicted HTH domain antitoxin